MRNVNNTLFYHHNSLTYSKVEPISYHMTPIKAHEFEKWPRLGSRGIKLLIKNEKSPKPNH